MFPQNVKHTSRNVVHRLKMCLACLKSKIFWYYLSHDSARIGALDVEIPTQQGGLHSHFSQKIYFLLSFSTSSLFLSHFPLNKEGPIVSLDFSFPCHSLPNKGGFIWYFTFLSQKRLERQKRGFGESFGKAGLTELKPYWLSFSFNVDHCESQNKVLSLPPHVSWFFFLYFLFLLLQFFKLDPQFARTSLGGLFSWSAMIWACYL